MDEAQIADLVAKTVAASMQPFAQQLSAINITLTELKAKPEAKPEVKPEPQQQQQAPAALPPEINSQLQDFKRQQEESKKQIDALTKAREDADNRALEAEKKSTVDLALSGFNFATPEARQTAFEKLSGEVKRDANGTLIAGDNLTPEAFAKNYVPEKHGYLLAVENRTGSGLSAAGRTPGGKAPGIETIRDGMTQDERTAVAAQIQSVLANR